MEKRAIAVSDSILVFGKEIAQWLFQEQRPRHSRNSGLHPANLLRRKQRLSFWPAIFCNSQGVTDPGIGSMPNFRKCNEDQKDYS